MSCEATIASEHYLDSTTGRTAQAVAYWQRAGQQARQHSANTEAVQHLTQGLALLALLPETLARAQQELALQLALGAALIAAKGNAAPEVEQTYARAHALCHQVGDTSQLFPTLRGLSQVYRNRGALTSAREHGEQLLALAQREAAPAHLLEAHDALGSILWLLGDYATARSHAEQGMALTAPTVQRASVLHQGDAPGVRCLGVAAFTLWCLGYPTQAVGRSQEALALAQELEQPYSLGVARHAVAWLHHLRREVLAVRVQADALLALATTQAFPLLVGYGTGWRGWVLMMQGQVEAGKMHLSQGLAATSATGQTIIRPLWQLLLAEAAGHAGQVAEGLHLLAEALGAFEASGQGHQLTEAHRLKGELLLQQDLSDALQAEACFQQALAIARRQQAKSWELRAAMSLSRLWQQQGKRGEARDLLAPIYGWFTEGFDTADLQEAKVLLEELGG